MKIFKNLCVNNNLEDVKNYLNNNEIEYDEILSGFKIVLERGNIPIIEFLYYNYNINDNDIVKILSDIYKNTKIENIKWFINILTKTTINNILYETCNNGEIEIAKWLLEVNPEIFTKDNILESFKYACENGKINILDWLINIKSDIITDEILLKGFINCGNLDVIKWILYIKRDIITNNIINSAFFNSCENNKLEIAKWLLKTKDNIITDETINTAFKFSNLIILKWLLRVKSDVITLGTINATFICSDINIIEWLLKLKYDLLTNQTINTSFLYNNIEVAKLLLKETENVITDESINIYFISKYQNFEVISWLLNEKLDVITEETINTTFIYLCQENNLDIIEILFEKTNDMITDETLKYVINIGYDDYDDLFIIEIILKVKPNIINIIDEELLNKIFMKGCENNNILLIKIFIEVFPEKFYIEIENDELIDYYIYEDLPIETNVIELKSTIEDSLCLICKDIESEIQTNCFHLFCNKCIRQWYSKCSKNSNRSCPYCRQNLKSFNKINLTIL
jgi:hypothetical protein